MELVEDFHNIIWWMVLYVEGRSIYRQKICRRFFGLMPQYLRILVKLSVSHGNSKLIFISVLARCFSNWSNDFVESTNNSVHDTYLVLETTPPPPTEAPIVVGISHSFATRDDEALSSGAVGGNCNAAICMMAATLSALSQHRYLRQLLSKEIDLYKIYVVEGRTNFPMS